LEEAKLPHDMDSSCFAREKQAEETIVITYDAGGRIIGQREGTNATNSGTYSLTAWDTDDKGKVTASPHRSG
jgi:hypothetical protein